MLRPIPESRPIPGSEGGTQPFFSPDGKELGFYTPASIRVMSPTGSRVLEFTGTMPWTWAFRGSLIFAGQCGAKTISCTIRHRKESGACRPGAGVRGRL